MNSIKNTIKNILNYIKLISKVFTKNYYNGKDPIFIITANRSGSSLLSNILRQHPDIYSLNIDLKKTTYDKINNHNRGFSEDFVWEVLNNYKNDHFNLKNDGYLWAHPKNLGDFYKEDFYFKSLLKREIYKKNIKKKIPIIKNPFFSLRIKLIKKIFPNAKIIYNVRSYKDWIRSGYHKWSNDNGFKKSFYSNKPDIGLHWLIINTITIYQLEKYFPKRFIVFYHESFYDKKVNKNKLMNEILKFLKLNKFRFNFDLVNKKYKYSKKINYDYEKFKLIKEVIKLEKKIF